MKQTLKTILSSTTGWAIVSLIAVLAWGWVDPFSIRQRLDWIVQDQFLQNHEPVDVHPDLLEVRIDEFAAVRLNRDAQRRQLGRAIHQLKQLGVKTILVDMLLFGRGSPDPVNIDDLVDQEGLPVAIAQNIDVLPNRFLEDQMLAGSLASFNQADSAGEDDNADPRIVIPYYHDSPRTRLDERSRAMRDAMKDLLKEDHSLDVKELADRLRIEDLDRTSRLYERASDLVADEIAQEPELERIAKVLQESMRARTIAWTPQLLAEEKQIDPQTAGRLFDHAYALALDRSLRDPRHVKQGIGIVPSGIALRVPMAFDRRTVINRLATEHSFATQHRPGLETVGNIDVPLSDFAEHAALGFANFDPDADGRFRRIPLIKIWDNDGESRGVIHQALAAVAVHHDLKISAIEFADRTTRIGTAYAIPVDSSGRLTINWPEISSEIGETNRIRLSLGELLELAKYDADLKQNRQNLRLNVAYLDNLLDLGFAQDDKCDILLNAIYEDYIAGRFDEAYEKEQQFDREYIPKALAHEKAREILARVGVEPLEGADAQDQAMVSAQLINKIRAAIGRIDAVRDAQIEAMQEQYKFAGKLCLIGDTRVASEDLKHTPVQRDVPGVTVNFAAINTILQRRYLSTPEIGTAALLTIVLAGCLTWVFQYTTAIWSFAVMAVELLVVFFGHYFALTYWDILASPVLPMAGVLTCFLIVTTRRWWTDTQEKQKIREAFQFYLHPAMVEKLTSDPTLVRLGGEDADLSILFADIRGFSGISEKLAPDQLQKFLNDFFTPMSRIAQEHGGTLDKYIGDEMMVFFGAPIPVSDHPLQAALTALKMLERLEELRAESRMKNLPDIQIGIGINSEVVRVGNFGSEERFDYTVIGDGVNLASRLQGTTKQYGVTIIVSENTWRQLDGQIVGREIDRIQVKGKLEPTRIFELIGESPADESTQAFLKHFNSGITAFQDREWQEALTSFGKAEELDPQDRPTKIYVERCQAFLVNPPPADWSGVTKLKSK